MTITMHMVILRQAGVGSEKNKTSLIKSGMYGSR